MQQNRFFSHTPLQVKICGLTTAEDAQAALDAGADALGFNFYPRSKRFVSLDTALAIIAKLPVDTVCVAVVVNPNETEVLALHKSGAFAAIQFHGDESPEFCAESGFPIWVKAIRIWDFEDAEKKIRTFYTPYILLDADAENAYGGTGLAVDFSLAAQITQAFPDKQFLLAGGLKPENVREAVKIVRPFAVDVASGVEDNSGRKNPTKIRNFIAAAQSA